MASEIGMYSKPSLVWMTNGEPFRAHSNAHSRLNSVALAAGFWIGQARSRTNPSIVTFAVGVAAAVGVVCGFGWDCATPAAVLKATTMQISAMRFIGFPPEQIEVSSHTRTL